MPIVGFTWTKMDNGRVLEFAAPLAEAPEYFERNGLMPAEAVLALASECGDERRTAGCGVSASMLDRGTTCRREVLINRYMDNWVDPRKLWDAEEGTLIHHVLFSTGGLPGWEREYLIPNERHANHPKVRSPKPGVWEYEIFPGVWLSGRVDKVKDDWSELHDFKTQRYSATDRGVKHDWRVQLNAYRFMLEDLEGVTVKAMKVWKIMRGSYDHNKTFKAYSEPDQVLLMDRAVWAEGPELNGRGGVREFAQEMTQLLEDCEKAEDKEGFIRLLPLDGKAMFTSRKDPGQCKCRDWCSVRPTCDRIQIGFGY